MVAVTLATAGRTTSWSRRVSPAISTRSDGPMARRRQSILERPHDPPWTMDYPEASPPRIPWTTGGWTRGDLGPEPARGLRREGRSRDGSGSARRSPGRSCDIRDIRPRSVRWPATPGPKDRPPNESGSPTPVRRWTGRRRWFCFFSREGPVDNSTPTAAPISIYGGGGFQPPNPGSGGLAVSSHSGSIPLPSPRSACRPASRGRSVSPH